MEVRCAGCNKLFRVSDDKIVGSGIKFPCTRCRQTVKITREDFDQYRLASEAALLLASVAPKSVKLPAESPAFEPASPVAPAADFSAAPADSSVFDLSDPATAAASLGQQPVEQEGEIAGLFDEPAPTPPAPAAVEPENPVPVQSAPPESVPLQKEQPAPKPIAAQDEVRPAAAVKSEPAIPSRAEIRPKPVATPVSPRPSAASAPAPKTEPKGPAPDKEEIKPAPRPEAAPASRDLSETAAPLSELLEKESAPGAPSVFDAAPAEASGFRKPALILAILLLVAGASVYGIMSYLDKEEPGPTATSQAPVRIVSPEGLQILNPSAGFDSAKGDLVITGTIENTTDKPKPGWYMVVEVFDAQNAVIAKARLLNGKQLYTRRDLDILVKRGANVEDLKAKSTDLGITIPPKGTTSFEIRILEAPAGVASFNPMLQPYDPAQLYKELAEEQK